MREYELKGKCIVQVVPSREMVLEYFMVKDCEEEKDNPFYGIEIRKTEGNMTEKEFVNGISYSKEIVVDLIGLMLKHSVTPISMIEIIDDYVTEKICS